MKYKYIAVFRIEGLICPPARDEVEIYADERNPQLRAVLTVSTDEYCRELDQAQALDILAIQRIAGRKESGDFMEMETNRIHERRNKTLAGATALIFIAEGVVDPDFKFPLMAINGCTLGYKLIDKDGIKRDHASQLNSILTVLCLSRDKETIQFLPVCEDTFLIDEAGRTVYSFDVRCEMDMLNTSQITDEIMIKLRGQAAKLIGDKTLARTNKLFVQALSNSNQLRRFIFGWAAIEIFVNKVFPEYEPSYVQEGHDADPPSHKREYFKYIRTTDGKYTLWGKFIVVASCLNGDSAERDIRDFSAIKKTRDVFFHGQDIDKNSLPVDKLFRLFRKYYQLHIGRIAS